jgi:phosphatidylserine/phosphatidylglycerophosphate/cardiolipin synthase-like enzyme
MLFVGFRQRRRTASRRAVVLLLLAGLAGGACTRADPHVSLPDVAVADETFSATVTAYTATPVVADNRVDLPFNGDQIFPALLAAIRSARHTINYAQYYWEDSTIGREVAEALAERCRAGVRVNVLLDGVGTLTNLDNRSFALNDEVNLVLYSRELAGRLDAVFADDLRRAQRVDYASWRARPLRDRLMEILVLPIRDLL